MKIAVIQRFLPSRSRGGAGYFADGLCRALAKRGHQVTAFSHDPAPQGAPYEAVVLPVAEGVKKFKLQPLVFPFQLARQDFSSFDIIHAQGDDQFIPRRHRPPVVRTIHASSLSDAVHNGLSFRNPKRFLMYLYLYFWEVVSALRADAVTAVSEEVSRHYPRVDAAIPNGIDVSFFSRPSQKTKHPTILFVGDLYTRKRGWLVAKVFQEEIRPQIPEAELWLVSPEEAKGEGVRWLGYLLPPELAKVYPQAWVFCLPSSSEGFGRPYVEAMAAGTPVVASPNPGAKDILRDGEYGFTASDEKLGETLRHLLRHEEIRQEYIKRGLERAKVYDWQHVVKQYESIYERLSEKRNPAAKSL